MMRSTSESATTGVTPSSPLPNATIAWTMLPRKVASCGRRGAIVSPTSTDQIDLVGVGLDLVLLEEVALLR